MGSPRVFSWGAALLVVALLAALLAAACVERPPARFPHLKHLSGVACGTPGAPACLDCNSCHSTSANGKQALPSDVRLCASCHRGDVGRVNALLAQPLPPRSEIGFNHDQHLAMAQIQGQCVSCHSGVVKSGAPALPPMSQCFTCHEHEREWQTGQCARCHKASDLAKTPPQTFLRHDQAFARNHGQMAVEERKLCQSCHTQAQCTACHDISQELTSERRRPEKVDAHQVHEGDFLVRHPIEARAQPAQCARCHTPQTCDSCHLQRGVSGNLLGAPNPHPPGWVGTNTQGSTFHGRDARRDILLCASCHDQGPATNCIRCHKVGAYGGNPHPTGWRSTRSPNESMCRYCHE